MTDRYKDYDELERELSELKEKIRKQRHESFRYADKKFVVEKKIDGFRILSFRKGDKVKLVTDTKHDATKAFTKIADQIPKLSDKDLIIDGEMVAYEGKTPIGRSGLIKSIQAIKTGKKIAPDTDYKYKVFDIVYYGKPLNELEWHQRKKYLKKLDFTDDIIEVPSTIVTNKKDLITAIEMKESLRNSEGALVKDYYSKYPLTGETGDWIKYKYRQTIYGKVIGIHEVKGTDSFNYQIGIEITKKIAKRVPKKNLTEYKKKPIMLLGNTFNTTLKAKKGDILETKIEEVWRHKKDGQLRYSMHKPTAKAIADRKTTSSIEDLDKLVVSRGQEVSTMYEPDTTGMVDVDKDSQVAPGYRNIRELGNYRKIIVIKRPKSQGNYWMAFANDEYFIVDEGVVEWRSSDTYPDLAREEWDKRTKGMKGKRIRYSNLAENDEDDEEGGTRSEAAFRFWDKQWHKMYPAKTNPNFAYQNHFRGLNEEESKQSLQELMKTNNSLHGDLRLEHNKTNMFGFTIFLGKAPDNAKLKVNDKLIYLAKHKGKGKIKNLQIAPKLKQPCISENSFVITDQGLLKAKDLEPGMKTLSKSGNIQSIVEVQKNIHKDNQFIVRPHYGLPSKVDGEHPFLVNNVRTEHHDKLSRKQRKKVKNIVKPEWKKAKDLKKGDYLLYPRLSVPENPKFKGYKFGKLIGLFLGDGTVAKCGNKYENGDYKQSICRISFDKSKKDIDKLINKYIKILKDLDIKSWVSTPPSNHSKWLTFNLRSSNESDPVCINGMDLRKLFGDECYRNGEKFAPFSLVKDSSNQFVKGLLSGLVDSDGYENNKNHKYLTNTSSSIIQIAQIGLARLGLMPSIRYRDNTMGESIRRERESKLKKIYEIGWKEKDDLGHKDYVTYEEYIGVRVRKIEKAKTNDTLVNIITEDHTFPIPFCQTHNSDWIKAGKPKPLVHGPGEIGATEKKYAKFFHIDSGAFTPGTWRKHMVELFMDGKKLKGRMLLMYAPVGGSRKWILDFPKDQKPYAETNKKEDIIKELHKKGQKYLWWNDPNTKKKPEKIDIDKAYKNLTS